MRWKTQSGHAEASDSPIAFRLEESDAIPELPDATNRFTLDEFDLLRIQNFENSACQQLPATRVAWTAAGNLIAIDTSAGRTTIDVLDL